MPALAKTPARLPRFVPHGNTQVICAKANAGAGDFSQANAKSTARQRPVPVAGPATRSKSSENQEDINKLAHDARNIVSALTLYCELLSTPGVLTSKHTHRAQELEVIVNSATQLIERMAKVKSAEAIATGQALPHVTSISSVSSPSVPVTDTAEELYRLQPLLAAIAGPAIRLSIDTMPCAGRIGLAVEDLTRILVNLVRNAVDAMPSRGSIRVTAQYGDGLSFLESAQTHSQVPGSVVLTVADDGPGIPEPVRERIFDLGFTTHGHKGGWSSQPRRGLGLSIVRNLVEDAGGTVRAAANLVRGARFEIVVPLLELIPAERFSTSYNSAVPNDGRAKGCLECH